MQLFLTRLKQNLKKVIVPFTTSLFFLFNKYVLFIVHHGHPVGERGFYTPKRDFNLSIYPKSNSLNMKNDQYIRKRPIFRT